MKTIIENTPFISETLNKYVYIYRIDYDNDDYYLGYHTTQDLFDSYTGSFAKEVSAKPILRTIYSFYETLKEVGKAERDLVGDLWKTDDTCINQVPGGCIGGWQTLPKEIVDVWRRENIYKFMEDKETWIKNCKKGGDIGSAISHKEKTPEGKSKMTSDVNKRRAGKKKIRKDWDKITPEDKKMFPRIYKRIENDYEFASAMCLPEDLNNLLDEGWYKAAWKTKGKSIHTKESKLKISNAQKQRIKS